MTDFHDYEGRLNGCFKRLEREKFSKLDQRLIRDYIYHCRAQNISKGRLFKILWTLVGTRRMMKVDFRKARRKDIERFVGDLNASAKYSPASKSDFKKILKKFYKYVRNGNADRLTPYPQEVAWIQTSIKKNETKEPDIITEDEAKTLIDAAPSSIDKALIALLYEGGFRISEALGMKIRDLTFDGSGARASVSGKTGPRLVRLIASAPLLSQYLQQHPLRGDENASLWYYFATMNTLKPMNYRTAMLIVKRAAKLGGIKKRMYPHLFRHSSATRDSAYGLNERILEIKYGWVKGSKMAGRYTHIQDEQVVDNALLRIYAKQQVKQPEPSFAPIACSRCGAPNTAGLRFCGRCGSPLSKEELAKSSIELEEMKRRMDELELKNSEHGEREAGRHALVRKFLELKDTEEFDELVELMHKRRQARLQKEAETDYLEYESDAAREKTESL